MAVLCLNPRVQEETFEGRSRMSYCFVLVESENPDNVGAAARAIKNMGMQDLRLVRPPGQWLEKGKKMAVSAADVLEKAKVFSDLESALKDVHFSLATTRRLRTRGRTYVEFDEAVTRIKSLHRRHKKIAIVFGKESKGLSNEDLLRCEIFTSIPASPKSPSLNLAQAVMVMAFCAARPKAIPKEPGFPMIPRGEVDEALRKVAEAVRALGYDESVAERIDFTFGGLVKRTGLVQCEAQMLIGLSRRICDRTKVTSGRINKVLHFRNNLNDIQ
jgi:TrmH family RNA methyltransferase